MSDRVHTRIERRTGRVIATILLSSQSLDENVADGLSILSTSAKVSIATDVVEVIWQAKTRLFEEKVAIGEDATHGR